MRVQLVAERLLDALLSRPVQATELDAVTAVIKTFERPAKLRRLVNSIRRHYPNLAVIVVDDSEKPIRLPGVETVVLPYDSGVSAGRNAGLARVDTDYVLILDDDFVFNRKTDVLRAVRRIANNPEIDILAGEVVYLPLRQVTDFTNAPLFPANRQPLCTPGALIDGLPVRNKVPNFYLGRTGKVREVGWDEALKRIDHADFFTRAVGRLVSVQDICFKVLHYPTYFDRRYMAAKRDVEQDRARLLEKYGGK
ncbi:MAG: glycosyltransferase [Halioglobus sp.]